MHKQQNKIIKYSYKAFNNMTALIEYANSHTTEMELVSFTYAQRSFNGLNSSDAYAAIFKQYI